MITQVVMTVSLITLLVKESMSSILIISAATKIAHWQNVAKDLPPVASSKALAVEQMQYTKMPARSAHLGPAPQKIVAYLTRRVWNGAKETSIIVRGKERVSLASEISRPRCVMVLLQRQVSAPRRNAADQESLVQRLMVPEQVAFTRLRIRKSQVTLAVVCNVNAPIAIASMHVVRFSMLSR
jgi:hypothetical protein|mmetsp:Transcript_85722/g.135378  ORF Transcript_85722/g.135378 Transcript_85722/m.135378 type:complete len:183 (-) Transcript_85722:21-569(-)